MSQLQKSSDTRNNTASQKYYISPCPIDNIQPEGLMSVDDKRTILNAIYKTNSNIQNKKQIVVKLGNTESIAKEYNISRTLQSIPGFMKYICMTTCHDDLKKYKNITNKTKLCSSSSADEGETISVLVMPFIESQSVRQFEWTVNLTKKDILKSVMKQLVISLYVAFEKYGFLHNDIHLDNVLLRKSTKTNVTYDNLANVGEAVDVPLHKHQICILDFDLSFIGLKRDWIHFYRDIYRIFSDFATYQNIKVKFTNEKEILDLCTSAMNGHTKSSINFLKSILKLIDNSEIIGKPDLMSMKFVYDPTIW